MSSKSREIKIQVQSFLSSEAAYWHGNSLRISLPDETKTIYDIRKEQGIFGEAKRPKKKFLFFETDKGLLVIPIEKQTEEKLKNVIGFAGKALTDEDVKALFEAGVLLT